MWVSKSPLKLKVSFEVDEVRLCLVWASLTHWPIEVPWLQLGSLCEACFVHVRNISGIALTAVFNATLGMLSVPGALLFPILLFSRSTQFLVSLDSYRVLAPGTEYWRASQVAWGMWIVVLTDSWAEPWKPCKVFPTDLCQLPRVARSNSVASYAW